jgi:hypothetical protein
VAASSLTYDVTFGDFKFLQGHMARRVFSRNRRDYVVALLAVVLCAFFLATAIVINLRPYLVFSILGPAAEYPISVYLLLIACLIAALLSLIPAVRLRTRLLRLQVSDGGPLLGSTKLILESDGLIVDRAVIRTKYLWAAFEGVEMAKNAVILPVDNGIAVIVPASAFTSDAERFDLAATISKQVDAARSASLL